MGSPVGSDRPCALRAQARLLGNCVHLCQVTSGGTSARPPPSYRWPRRRARCGSSPSCCSRRGRRARASAETGWQHARWKQLTRNYPTATSADDAPAKKGLLTREEERRLGEQTRELVACRAKKKALEEVLGRAATPREWAAELGFESAAALDAHLLPLEAAREALVLSNLRLVVKMAASMLPRTQKGLAWTTDRDGGGLSMSDLAAEGNPASSARQVRARPRLQFSTYATWWVRQSLHLAVHSRYLVKIPIYLQLENSKATPRPSRCARALALRRPTPRARAPLRIHPISPPPPSIHRIPSSVRPAPPPLPLPPLLPPRRALSLR